VDQLAKLLTELFLDGRRDLGVGGRVQAAARHLGSKPVGLGEADCEGDKVLFDLLGREVDADLVERFDSLAHRRRVSHSAASPRASQPCTYLVSHDGLLYSREVLERGEQHMAPLRAADVLDEVAEFLAKGNKDLVLVFDRLCRREEVSDR
jgi:hypothetical protein